MRWIKTFQCVGNTLLLHILSMSGHPAGPVAAYKQLLQASFTKAANQPSLTFVKKGQVQTVIVNMLARALRLMLQELGLDMGLYSLHSLCRGGTVALYRAGADHLDRKRHGHLTSGHGWLWQLPLLFQNFHTQLSCLVTTCHTCTYVLPT